MKYLIEDLTMILNWIKKTFEGQLIDEETKEELLIEKNAEEKCALLESKLNLHETKLSEYNSIIKRFAFEKDLTEAQFESISSELKIPKFTIMDSYSKLFKHFYQNSFFYKENGNYSIKNLLALGFLVCNATPKQKVILFYFDYFEILISVV